MFQNSVSKRDFISRLFQVSSPTQDSRRQVSAPAPIKNAPSWVKCVSTQPGRSFLLLTFICLFSLGCDIKETNLNQGQIFVELRDSLGTEILGARIWLNGTAKSQVTPDTIRQIEAGVYNVTTSKPGFLQASEEVTVVAELTTFVSLTTGSAPFAAIELVNAPDGTEIIIEKDSVAVVPPTLYGLSVGTWNVSAYLAGNSTDNPARWTVTLAEGDTAHINAHFTPLAEGSSTGSLAPVFRLPGDQDSSIFRLQDYRGKITLTTFFFYNCVPCLSEFPHIQEVFADEAYAEWFEVLGIDGIDPWPIFRTYKANHPTLGLQFPLLRDQGGQIVEQYEVANYPTNFLIDPSGVIRYRWNSITEEELRGAVEALIVEFENEN